MAIHTHPVIARSKATWQSIFQAVPDARWIASPSARNDGGAARNDPNSCHCEEQSDVAIHTHSVIARSAATWQSIPTPSLRGAKRRGNPYFRQCRTLDGLLRLRLAMTVGRLAMTLFPVIARSKATWQSIPPCHCEEQSDVAIHTPLSLRGAKRRGNPHPPRHCEEQSDVAIHISGGAGR